MSLNIKIFITLPIKSLPGICHNKNLYNKISTVIIKLLRSRRRHVFSFISIVMKSLKKSANIDE